MTRKMKFFKTGFGCTLLAELRGQDMPALPLNLQIILNTEKIAT